LIYLLQPRQTDSELSVDFEDHSLEKS